MPVVFFLCTPEYLYLYMCVYICTLLRSWLSSHGVHAIPGVRSPLGFALHSLSLPRPVECPCEHICSQGDSYAVGATGSQSPQVERAQSVCGFVTQHQSPFWNSSSRCLVLVWTPFVCYNRGRRDQRWLVKAQRAHDTGAMVSSESYICPTFSHSLLPFVSTLVSICRRHTDLLRSPNAPDPWPFSRLGLWLTVERAERFASLLCWPYTLDQSAFVVALGTWSGDFDMDLMATPTSAQRWVVAGESTENPLPFYSRYRTEGCAGLDLFAQDVGRVPDSGRPYFGCCYPPTNMVGVVLQHLDECQARAVVFVPDQKQFLFPQLASVTVKSKRVSTPRGLSIFFRAHHQRGRERLLLGRWAMRAVEVDFRQK